MSTVSRTFTVELAPALTLDYLKDFRHTEQWDPGTRSCERIDTGPIAEGAYWHNVSKLLGLTVELTFRLDDVTDRRLVFVGENQSARITDTITVEPKRAGSTITYRSDLETYRTARIFSPLITLLLQKRAADIERRMSAVLNRLATVDI